MGMEGAVAGFLGRGDVEELKGHAQDRFRAVKLSNITYEHFDEVCIIQIHNLSILS